MTISSISAEPWSAWASAAPASSPSGNAAANTGADDADPFTTFSTNFQAMMQHAQSPVTTAAPAQGDDSSAPASGSSVHGSHRHHGGGISVLESILGDDGSSSTGTATLPLASVAGAGSTLAGSTSSAAQTLSSAIQQAIQAYGNSQSAQALPLAI
jgi:hypothetical protein